MASGELTPEHIFFFAKTAQKADKRPPFNQSIDRSIKSLCGIDVALSIRTRGLRIKRLNKMKESKLNK